MNSNDSAALSERGSAINPLEVVFYVDFVYAAAAACGSDAS